MTPILLAALLLLDPTGLALGLAVTLSFTRAVLRTTEE